MTASPRETEFLFQGFSSDSSGITSTGVLGKTHQVSRPCPRPLPAKASCAAWDRSQKSPSLRQRPHPERDATREVEMAGGGDTCPLLFIHMHNTLSYLFVSSVHAERRLHYSISFILFLSLLVFTSTIEKQKQRTPPPPSFFNLHPGKGTAHSHSCLCWFHVWSTGFSSFMSLLLHSAASSTG